MPFIDKSYGEGPKKTAGVSLPIEEVLEKHTEELMSIPGVVAVGEGLCDNNPCVKVYLSKKSPDSDGKIPRILEGYEVATEVIGEIKTQPGTSE